MWLKHRTNYYMPPTTTYMFTCMHVGKYVSYLPKVGGFLRVLRFPPPIKLTRHDMTLDVESGVKHQSINKSITHYRVSEILKYWENVRGDIYTITLIRIRVDWLVLNATFNILGHIVTVSFIGQDPEETADLRQVSDVLPNMNIYKHECSGWWHVIISTVL